PAYLQRRGIATGRAVSAARVLDVFPGSAGTTEGGVLITRGEFRAGIPEAGSLPLTLGPEAEMARLLGPVEEVGFAVLGGPTPGVLCKALAVPACCQAVLQAILSGKVTGGPDRQLAAVPLPATLEAAGPVPDDLPLSLRRTDSGNASVVYGESFIYKSFRRVEDGLSPDVELGRVLAAAGFSGAAPLAGDGEYR